MRGEIRLLRPIKTPSRLRKKSIRLSILGGAALQRRDNRFVLNCDITPTVLLRQFTVIRERIVDH